MGQKFATKKDIDSMLPSIITCLAEGYTVKETANRNKINVALVNSIKKNHKREIESLKSNNAFIHYNEHKNVISDNKRMDVMIEDLEKYGKAISPQIKREPLIITFDQQDFSEEVVEEIEVKNPKHYSSDGICYEDLLEDYCNIENTTRSICEKYGISNGKLYALLADACGGKENIPYKRRCKGVSTILTDDQVIELVTDYESGTNTILVKDILIKYNLTCVEMYDYLTNYYGTHDNIPKRRNVGSYKKNAKEENNEDMSRTNAKKRRGSYKGNNHQYKKKLEKIKEEEIKSMEEEIADEVISESAVDNSIDYIGKVFELDNVFRLLPSDTTVQAGLVAGRHNIPVNNYIYSDISDDNMCNYEWQYNTAVKWLDENIKDGQTLVLYCTGIQSALSAVISACLEKKINLTEMHHNPLDGKYYSQQVLSFTDVKVSIWPFAKFDNTGIKFYGYNVSSDNIESIVGDMYCLSLAEHSEYNNEFIKDKCRYIIFKPEDEDALWEYYRKMIKEVHSVTGNSRNSVMMSNIVINQDSIVWSTNISKGYNWK